VNKKIICFLICLIFFSFFNGFCFPIKDKGTETIVDYQKYGKFKNIGTPEYEYIIEDPQGLAAAQGLGIYPNEEVFNDLRYLELKKQGKLKGDKWKYINSNDPERDFYKWASARKTDPAIKLFFIARALENAGLYEHAIKAYYAVMILYPNSFSWNRTNTWTWLIAISAWDSMINIIRMYPEINLDIEGTFIKAKRAIKGNPRKNMVALTPGKIFRRGESKYSPKNKSTNNFQEDEYTKIKDGRVSIFKGTSSNWQLRVDQIPFFIKGIHYAPTKVGRNYEYNWMYADHNKNNIIDSPYESWVDTNNNSKQDEDEPAIGDFQLLKDMGCNTIRIMSNQDINKELLTDMYKNYGIMVLLCDPLGAYTVHSGASWEKGTDYTSKKQKKNMLKALKKTVLDVKDQPWLLGYILGNENNMSSDYSGVNATRTNAGSKPKAYAEFLNECAKMVHQIDKDHPVGVGNLGTGLLDHYNKYAQELDFLGINEYKGNKGFGSLFIEVKKTFDRPIVITEFGCDAYWTSKGIDYKMQQEYIANAWDDIVYNSYGKPGEGNCIGGIVFEWLDEWWKDTRMAEADHDKFPASEMDFPDGWAQEEYFGIVSQGSGRKSPFFRYPRNAYYMLKDNWAEKNV